MKTLQILISGFGGQGVLFLGKILAYQGLLSDKQVSWLPTYGPEMRGGTAGCSVIVGDEPIGSPIVSRPDCLVAMNLPSLDKYEDAVAPGGKIFYDSTLIGRKVRRTDVEVYAIPATRLANEQGTPTLANMMLLGKLLACCEELGMTNLEAALKKCISAKHIDMLPRNMEAIAFGAAAE